MKKIIVFGLFVVFSTSLSMYQRIPTDVTKTYTYNEHLKEGHFFAVYGNHSGSCIAESFQKNFNTQFINELTKKLNKDNVLVREVFCQIFNSANYHKKYVKRYTTDKSTTVIAYIANDGLIHIAYAGNLDLILHRNDKTLHDTQDNMLQNTDEKQYSTKYFSGNYCIEIFIKK
jgi:hypothetical protein